MIKLFSDSSRGHQEGGLHDSTPEVLHLILSSVFCDSASQFGKCSVSPVSIVTPLNVSTVFYFLLISVL